MTPSELLAALQAFTPAVDDGELTFDELPLDLEAALRILHTGVRAMMTGRKWYGCDGKTGRVIALNPAATIPPGVTLLCVEGDADWDRPDPAARIDLPRLFVAE